MWSLREVIIALYQSQLGETERHPTPFDASPEWMGKGERQEVPFLEDVTIQEERDGTNDVGGIPQGFFPIREEEGHLTREESGRTGEVRQIWNTPLGRETGHLGVEALAWYTPFHVSRGDWGIYYRETCVRFLSDYLESMGVHPTVSVSLAVQFLDAHEQLHGVIEASTTVLELAGQQGVYLSRPFGARSAYVPRLTNGQLEEALGNSYAMSRRNMRPARGALENFASHHQPIGYQDWQEVSWWQKFDDCMSQVLDEAAQKASLGRAPWFAYLRWARERSQEVPRFIVRDAKPGRGIIFGFRYDGLEIQVHFSNEHPPPHFHVRFPPRTGRDCAYTYPDLSPARTKDPPLNNRQRTLIQDAIDAYPRATFEGEFNDHALRVEAKFQEVTKSWKENSLQRLERLKGRLTPDQFDAARRKIEERDKKG